MDKIRVLRIIEYVGPRDRVEETVARSVHGTKDAGMGLFIKAATIGNYPDILEHNIPPPQKYAISEGSGLGYIAGPFDTLEEAKKYAGPSGSQIVHIDGGGKQDFDGELYDKALFYWSDTLENWIPFN